jgi:hypothetical protein
MNKIKLYSPWQIFAAAFVGGPFGLLYPLKKNFDALGNTSASRKTITWGGAFIAALMALSWLLPKAFGFGMAISYAIFGKMYADQNEMSKKVAAEPDKYEYQSIGNVALVILGSLVAFFGIVLVLSIIVTAFIGLTQPA